MGVLFGTDGVREIANGGLTPELAFRLGRAGAAMAARAANSARRPSTVVGGDTRRSTGMLEAAVAAGIMSAGCDAIRVGVVPTPAVARLTVAYGAAVGIVISASHNPVEYNGIKLFGSDGFKLPDEVEDLVESYVLKGSAGSSPSCCWAENDGLPRPTGSGVGMCSEPMDSWEHYVEFVVSSARHDLSGLHIVLDCANGASSRTSPEALRRLGARVSVIHDSPDGDNVNMGCGSTHPEALCRAVQELGADMGFAHDGDADRVLAADSQGNLVDGDQIMALCAAFRFNNGELTGNALVATQYSNLGLQEAMRRLGIDVVIADNGDRYVLQEMLNRQLVLGGEQSGHIIMLDKNTTGDGLITAVEVASIVASTGASLAELAGVMRKFPQVLVNVRVSRKDDYHRSDAIAKAVADASASLGADSRLVVRPSGTEPLIRVMGEGPDEAGVWATVESVAQVIKRELE